MAKRKRTRPTKVREGKSAEQIARERITQAEREASTELDLSELRLTALPPEVGRLSRLTHLTLSHNQLTALPPEIGQLTRLTRLSLHSNKLRSLPLEITRLSKLTGLFVGQNRLTALPAEIERFGMLSELFLFKNELTALPAEIAHLNNLTALSLSHNGLTAVPAEIGRLRRLVLLNLSHNQLTALPPELRELTALDQLYLHDNDALGLPPEVLGPSWHDVRGPAKETAAAPADILDYYFRRQVEAKRRLSEAKLLLVGQGGVGKTSLVSYLVHNKKAKPGEPTTEGIDISSWQATSRFENEEIRLNVWDFGGQEIMHATHQFFLTRRSLYLLVLDARKGENEGNIHYWLRIIQSYGGDSPVIVVTNQCDGPNDLDVNEHRLQADYPNIQEFVKTSCTTGRGIEELRELIADQVNDLPHVFDELPESYFTIKRQLADRAASDNYLDVRDYQALCRDNSVTEEAEQQRLLRFLHDLGTVLNYNDPHDPYRLRDTHILNAEWVTDGVYSIVNHAKPKQAHGVLDCDALGEILEDRRAYPPDRRAFIVGMMRRFELCFDFPDSQGRHVLIPELLPKNEPRDLPWRAEQAVRFEYHYKVLPAGLLPRFIVRTNYLLSKPPIYWRSGVVLQVEKCEALVRGDTQRGRVFITVVGAKVPGDRRRALSVARDHFRAIHATIPRIEAVEKVPLPDRPDIVADYETLLRMELAGSDEYWPDGGDHAYSVHGLLDGIEDADDPEVRERRNAVLSRMAAGRPEVAESAPRRGDTFVFKGPVGHVGVREMNIDESRKFEARDITGSTINLGEIRDSVVESIAQIPAQADETTAQLKPLLEKLTELLGNAPEQGVEPQVAADALEEVKTIADAAQKPQDNRFLGAVRKTLRTLRGIATELKGAPAVAAQFKDYVDQIGDLFTG